MEAWTFTKEDKIIRYNKYILDDEFADYDTIFIFSEKETDYPWFVLSEKEAIEAYQVTFSSPLTYNHNRPNTEDINLSEWQITKFSMNKNPLD